MQQIWEFFTKLLDSSDWPPRWHCGRWTEFHGWLYIVSDLAIWSAYFTIPLVIIKYISRKNDIRFVRLYFLFAGFILSCGSTHFLDAVAFWLPAYRLNALMRFITGVLSWITVFYLIRLLPLALKLRSQKELEVEINQRALAEEKFKGLLEAAPDAMIISNEKGEIMLVNRQTEILFGYERNDLMGNQVELLIPADLRSKHIIHRNEYNAVPSVRSMGAGLNLYGQDKDGRRFPVEISLAPLKTGEEILVSVSVRDVSDRKNMEKKLAKANKDFQLLVNSVKDYAIFLLDKDGCVASWNNGAKRMKGYNKEEIVGKPISVFYRPEEMEVGVPQRNLQMTLEHGHFETEGWRVRKDGSAFYADVALTTLFDEEGGFYGFTNVTKDITEKIRRTKELQEANSEMEAFTYSVSHDLRAPLRGIIGYASMLEEDYASKLDEEARRITGVIKKNTIRMGCLIDDLLAFSRVGKKEMSKDIIDMAALVRQVISDLFLGSGLPVIEWQVGDLPEVEGDLTTIRQVWINLISNAVKYSGKMEHPHIKIGSFVQSGQKAFFVKDNGVGFNNIYADKLFKVFQRLHGADEFEGTGIGLALAMKIVAKHDGRMWAEGEEGKGACFYFSLPESKS